MRPGHKVRSGAGSSRMTFIVSPGSSSVPSKSKTRFIMPSASRGNCGGSGAAALPEFVGLPFVCRFAGETPAF